MRKKLKDHRLPKNLSSSHSDLKDYIIFMLKYAKSYKKTLSYLMLIIIVFIVAGRLIPLIFGWAVDYGIEEKNIKYIYICGVSLVISNALRAVLSYVISFQLRQMGQKILYEIRRDLLDHIQKIKMAFFDKNPSGKIVTRIANDTRSLGDLFAEGFSGVFINIIEIISILVTLFLISWPMALIVVFTLPPVLWLTKFLSEKIREQFILIKSKLSTINAFCAENLNGIEVLHLYGGEPLAIKNFNRDSDEYKHMQLKSVFYFALLWPVVEFFQVFSILLSLIIGFHLLNSDLITIGKIGAFVLMLQSFFRPLRFILEKYNQVQNGITSSQRIIRLFDEKTEDENHKTQQTNKNFDLSKPVIEVKNLSFAYNKNQEVLKNINFQIKYGSKTAIVGRTGSGKTTLISLLQGFYESTPLTVWINNIPIENQSKENLRKNLLVVRQDEFIFKGTVKSNISIGCDRNLSTRRLNEVIEQIGLNLTLDAPIDEMGANLSAGEKQLIALARVMVYDPEIIILDEATSHIDSISEQRVLNAFDKVLEGRTSIVIAHRLTTVLKSDQILVLDKGQLVEAGSPKQLMENPNSLFNTFYDELM